MRKNYPTAYDVHVRKYNVVLSEIEMLEREIEDRKKIVEGKREILKAMYEQVNGRECKDLVNHPEHYQGNKYEVIDIIEDYELNFKLGSAIKYILRAGKKDDKDTDLKKAIWMIEREINNG